MDRRDVSWRGYWPAAPTPFDSAGHLDEDALRRLMDLYVRQGVHGILVNGSTGEWFSQTPAERRDVARIAVSEVAGRCPVVIGVTAYTAAEAIELARHAAEIGADGVLATPPPYVHPSADETFAFYREVSGGTDLPFMVYNWPRGVAVDMGRYDGLFQRLADLPQVVAIKDSTGDWLSMISTVEQCADRVAVFGSFLHRRGLAVLLGVGGDGNIDGGGVGAPYAVPYYACVQAKDRDGAIAWVDRYQSLSGKLINPDYSGIFASPIPQLKAVMALLGQPGGRVRPPLLPVIEPTTLAAIRKVVEESGIG
ncbi:4-hydroxy-tetrahydrodipicolinate synthase [Nakamurella sp. UYEF19]|uniref:dihydrodipicolinate synthase family protein n=1 Tax=Nakamurella sp. UYEF19 TaxID=1756392 RepID=UPI00339A82E6